MGSSATGVFPPTAILNQEGYIVGVNPAWKAFREQNRLSAAYPAKGKNFVAISQQAGEQYGDRVAAELHRLLADEQTAFTVKYPCHSPNQERWFRLCATAMKVSEEPYYLLVHRRLDQHPPALSNAASDGAEAPPNHVGHRNRNRVVSYELSSKEGATDGLLDAFVAIGVDPQRQDTTLHDWIHPEALDRLQRHTAEFHITFPIWNYRVSITPEEVTIYTPEG